MRVKVWVYRAGFCRFSHARYSNATEDLEDMEKHLTNVAIQVRRGMRLLLWCIFHVLTAKFVLSNLLSQRIGWGYRKFCTKTHLHVSGPPRGYFSLILNNMRRP